jgi:hypothetical protein
VGHVLLSRVDILSSANSRFSKWIVYKVSSLPSPSLLSTTLVSPARRERHLPVSHGLRSLFPFPFLFSHYFPLFYHISPFIITFPSKSRRPPRCPPHLVLTRVCCRLLPECRPPCCGEFSSLGATPPRVLRERGGRLSSHLRGRDGARVKTRPGIHPSVPLMPRQGPLRQPRLGNSLRCRLPPFLPCPRMLREECSRADLLAVTDVSVLPPLCHRALYVILSHCPLWGPRR